MRPSAYGPRHFLRDGTEEARISYDMWIQELERAELAYRFRRYDFPLGGGAAHSGGPSFLISSHLVDSASDMAGDASERPAPS